ncbi:SLAIN motif-containing protein 1-like isoform X1 [Megalops cyprinoides]|uniref:SLAIN motif-containing protein 1-like isoform X1 n=1 Tax=Megalops cyprinoides TaxID=118141 RepID=UPI0018641D89|nr:SLAIN motif-containing protein 1-like isoform X1 [Megalops cyprinoides]
MEATVLHSQMMADVNCNKNVNAELEVKKLQELVRKLEKQNEQLRTRANAVSTCTATSHILQSSSACLHRSSVGAAASPVFAGSYCIPSPLPTLFCPSALDPFCEAEEPFSYFHTHSAPYAEAEDVCNDPTEPTVLDEVDILDLNSLLPCNEGSEDTWLYVSPKAKPWREYTLSPLQWCRQVLDNPRPEVEAAKRSLCHRLEQAHRWRGVVSSRVSPALTPVAGVPPLRSSFKPCSKPAVPEQAASSSSSSHTPLHLTPTANGKGCSDNAERSPSFLCQSANLRLKYGMSPINRSEGSSRRQLPLSRQSSLDSELSTSELEDDSISMGYKLQDLTDVQVMARLQEESLRQDYASSSASINRRSSSFSFYSRRRGVGSQPDLPSEERCDGPPPLEARLGRAMPLQRGLPHSHTFSSVRDCRRGPSAPQHLSNLSYHQYSSPAVQGYIPEVESHRPSTGPTIWNQPEYENKLQRSMPNLVRAPSMPSVPSMFSIHSPAGHTSSFSSIRNSHSFDSSNALAKLQSSIPSPGQLQHRVQSVGNFSTSARQPLKATAYVSPTIQGPSSANAAVSSHSSIPLPSKPSGLSAMGRSGLPRPASFIGTTAIPRSKIAQPMRSLLNPPKSLSALSTLRDSSWRDGCY